MRPADPVHNVELRRDRHGHESVVLAFPYRADIVDAVRAIPGRRFDWERREWWAPQADATAPYVKGVVERHPGLSVAPDVAAWLAEAATGWVGRVTTARYDGAGWFLLETISGELDEPLAGPAEARAGRLWIPFAQDTADALLELRGARLDPAALRCAIRLQVGQAPAPAALTLTEGVGERRFQLEVNWDADTVRPFLELPACEAHGRTLPVDPYLVEPLEAYLRDPRRRGRAGRARRPGRAARRARRGGRRRPPLARPARASPSRWRRCSAASCAPSSARASPTCSTPGARSSPTSRASARPCRRSPPLEADGAYPAVVVCPASLKLNWAREAERWLPHRTLTVISGTGGAPRPADITVLNYEIVHAHHDRLARARPRALVLDESHYVKNPRAKRTRALRRLAATLPPGGLRLALTGTPVSTTPRS